jgi:hypothetical protein
MEQDAPTPEGRWLKWLKGNDPIASLSFALALISFVISSVSGLVVWSWNESNKKIERSIAEVNAFYEQSFAISLGKVVKSAYNFYDDPTLSRLKGVERFEKFWYEADADPEMLVITSRLGAITNCIRSGACDREAVFSRFPDTIYQALFYLREFIFLDDELDERAEKIGLNGWWFGRAHYSFLADYCAWAIKPDNLGGMGLWDAPRERKHSPKGELPHPCFPPLQASDAS